jgi:hypothetical protein
MNWKWTVTFTLGLNNGKKKDSPWDTCRYAGFIASTVTIRQTGVKNPAASVTSLIAD